MRAFVALPLAALALGSCAKLPKNGVGNGFTRLTFTVTMAGAVNPNYFYIVAIRPLTGLAPADDGFGPVPVYTITTGNPKNGLVEGRPTRFVMYDPTAANSYRIEKFGTRTPTTQDDNPIDLAQISDVGTVLSSSDPQTSGFPNQMSFSIYTSDLVDDSTTAQAVTAIQFNIIAANRKLLGSGDLSDRISDALGNVNNLGLTGLGYRQVYINTSTGYSNANSTDVEGANDTYNPSGKYDPTVDIVDWNLDVSTP